MQHLTLEQTADYLETATIEHTHDAGYAVVHVGRNAAGASFVLVNDAHGRTVVTESL
jgi:D-aminopeptidase